MFHSIRRRIVIVSVFLILVCIGALIAYLITDSSGHYNASILGIFLFAAFLTLIVMLQVASVTTKQVKMITQAARTMTEGELDQRIPATSEDEVGELAQAFNRMSLRLREIVTSLTAERDKMVMILSTMGDGIFVINRDSTINAMNKAAERILNISEDKALGRTFVEAIRDYELDSILQRSLKTRTQQMGTVETRPGKQLLGVIATPFSEDQSCLLLVQDLTELRRLEKVRRDFIANISHEIRTPVASLKALAETLREGAINDSSVAGDFLNKIIVEADRLTQLIEELAELSRIESGEAPFEKEPFDLTETIMQATGRLRTQADRSGLNIHTSIQSDLPLALGDQQKLEQVLLNILYNAIKFTPSGGDITITARLVSNNLQVSVSDNGAGIPESELPRIFERFYKVDKARGGTGTGLGLAIAKHIIEAHGGKIWAESIEGRGSTFHFTLPSI